jgi:glycine dehydrogenase
VHGTTREAGAPVFFDTLTVTVPSADATLAAALAAGINIRKLDATTVGVYDNSGVTRGCR